MRFSRDDRERLEIAIATQEPVVYDFVPTDRDEFPGARAREVMILSAVNDESICGRAVHYQTWAGDEQDCDHNGYRSFNEIQPGSVRRLCDIPVPEFDDRPNVMLPEDFYTI